MLRTPGCFTSNTEKPNGAHLSWVTQPPRDLSGPWRLGSKYVYNLYLHLTRHCLDFIVSYETREVCGLKKKISPECAFAANVTFRPLMEGGLDLITPGDRTYQHLYSWSSPDIPSLLMESTDVAWLVSPAPRARWGQVCGSHGSAPITGTAGFRLGDERVRGPGIIPCVRLEWGHQSAGAILVLWEISLSVWIYCINTLMKACLLLKNDFTFTSSKVRKIEEAGLENK